MRSTSGISRRSPSSNRPASGRPDSSAPRAAGRGEQTLTTRRKLCISALNPSRISTVRYSATERSSPEKSVRKAAGSSLRRRASAASRSPAAQPSVRACSPATSAGVSCRPAACSSEVVSSRVKRRTSARSSCSRPSSRSRGMEIGGSVRLARTSLNPAGRRRINRTRSRSTSCPVSSWTSSRTTRTGGSKPSSASASSSTRSTARGRFASSAIRSRPPLGTPKAATPAPRPRQTRVAGGRCRRGRVRSRLSPAPRRAPSRPAAVSSRNRRER